MFSEMTNEELLRFASNQIADARLAKTSQWVSAHSARSIAASQLVIARNSQPLEVTVSTEDGDVLTAEEQALLRGYRMGLKEQENEN